MNTIFRTLLSFVLGLGAPALATACLNDYRPNVAAIKRSDSLFEQLTQHAVAEPWTTRRDRLRKLLAEGGDFRVKNDLATTLIHTGEVGESVRLLEEIEAQKPGLYSTASNLGTAHELSGDNRKALEWIRKGIERNPDAHDGSEWLHVRILEAKLAIAETEDWLKTNSVPGLQLTESGVTTSAIGNRGEQLTLDQVKTALIYQLHERLQFVRPPDSLVGALLLDLGDLVAKESVSAGGALGVVTLATSYLQGLPPYHPLVRRAGALETIAHEGQKLPDPPWWRTPDLLVVLFVGGLACYLFITIKKWIAD